MALWDVEVKNAAAHWAKQYGIAIDPALVHAIIERESAHGQAPNYIVHHGAVPEPGGHTSYGPMQVYDDTVHVLNPTLDPMALAQSPGLGIWYGTHYLAQLLKRFRGDVAAAIAAYNAGPGNATRNSAGRFVNQSYVDAVTGFWKRYGGAAMGALPVLALVAGVAWFAMSRRRRAA